MLVPGPAFGDFPHYQGFLAEVPAHTVPVSRNLPGSVQTVLCGVTGASSHSLQQAIQNDPVFNIYFSIDDSVSQSAFCVNIIIHCIDYYYLFLFMSPLTVQ